MKSSLFNKGRRDDTGRGPPLPRPARLAPGRQDSPPPTTVSETDSVFSLTTTSPEKTTMGKFPESVRFPPPPPRGMQRGWIITGAVISALILLATFPQLRPGFDQSGSAYDSAGHFVNNA